MRPHAAACGPRARRPGGWTAPFRWPAAGPRQPRAAWAAHGPAWAEQRLPSCVGRHGMRPHAVTCVHHARRPDGWAAPSRWPGDGPSSAARRMGRAWARTWAEQRLLRQEDACAPHAAACGPMRGVWVAGPRPFRWPGAGPCQPRAACAAHGPAWADVRGAAGCSRVSRLGHVCAEWYEPGCIDDRLI
jgi:hypothetical protein